MSRFEIIAANPIVDFVRDSCHCRFTENTLDTLRWRVWFKHAANACAAPARSNV